MGKRKANGAKTIITKEQLDAVLKYETETGQFIRLKTTGGKKAGTVAGYVHKHLGYVEIRVKGKAYYAHRLAHLTVTGEWPANQMDHVNHIRHDNRWSNLRPASPAQNTRNQPGWSSSGYKCIVAYDTKSFGQRFRVEVTRDGETTRKLFGDLDHAIAFRDAVIKAHDGEFANTSHRDDAL